MNFSDRLSKAASASAVGGTAGASIGVATVSGVCAIGGSVFGPAGTFFGATIGTGVGASVGGAVGSIVGFIGSLVFDNE